MDDTTIIEVGKIYVDRQGAGRIYLPKKIVNHLNLKNKEHLKLEANTNTLKITPIT
jgi:antitoxin component of MazEF toxin-antitoxin module